MSRTHYIILGVVGLAVLILILVFSGSLPGLRPQAQEQAEINFWGIENQEVWSAVFAAFREQHPNLTVTYQRIDEDRYEDILVNSLAEGKGPDVFMLPHTYLTKHRNKISPLPPETGFGPSDFRNAFVDLPSQELISPENQIWGLPLFLDTLALFYNKDIFNDAGLALPPKTWDEVILSSQKLTKTTPNGDITQSGIALGAAGNVDHGFEILSALMIQKGDQIVNPTTGDLVLGKEAGDALSFYGSFADASSKNFSWNSRFANSLAAFAQGNTGMVFGFARDISSLLAQNPHLNFNVVPFPKSKITEAPVTYGRYYFLTVSKLSAHPAAAWQFALYAAGKDGVKSYLEKTNLAPALRSLIATNPPANLNIFYRQALIAKDWMVSDEKPTRELFKEAIESVNSSPASKNQAVARLREKLKFLLP